MTDLATKTCRKCLSDLPISEFYPTKGRHKDGLHPWCKECTKSYNREYVRNNPERNRERQSRNRIKAKYGITWQDRDRMVEVQEGRCAICRDPFPDAKGTHIDHCHASGKVREILCGLCNVGLGSFRDNPDLLRAAAEYLERHRE